MLAKNILRLTTFCTVLLWSGYAFAEVTGAMSDPTSTLGQLYDFIRSGRGTAAAGTMMVLIVWGLRNGLGGRWAWFKTPAGGYVLGFSTAALLYIGTALASSNPMTASLVLNGLGAGWVAAGGWEHARDLLSWLKAPPAAPAPVTPPTES